MEAPFKMDLDELRSLLSIEYNVRSHLGIREPGRYIQHIHGKLYFKNELVEKQKQAGSIEGYKILLGEAINNNVGIFNVFDMETQVYVLGEAIMDSFEKLELHKLIRDQYNDEFNGFDLLVLTRIEITEEFRGNQLGKLFVKDFYNNFISGCQLFVADFTGGHANDKLMFYFSRMGFDIIPRFSNEIMFMNPAFDNPSLKEIILD